jgi:hypothetical protein
MTVNTPADSTFWMGRQTTSSFGDFRRLDGMVDEVTVYDRALSAAEINSIYNAGSDGKIKDPQGPSPAGDYNGNGQVEQGDLDLVLLHWGQDAANVPSTWTGQPPSGRVDQNELDAVLRNWGTFSAATGAIAPAPLLEANASRAPAKDQAIVIAAAGIVKGRVPAKIAGPFQSAAQRFPEDLRDNAFARQQQWTNRFALL